MELPSPPGGTGGIGDDRMEPPPGRMEVAGGDSEQEEGTLQVQHAGFF